MGVTGVGIGVGVCCGILSSSCLAAGCTWLSDEVFKVSVVDGNG